MSTDASHFNFNVHLGRDETGVILQREYREGDCLVWRNYLKDGKVVKSSVDLDALPVGRYRLVYPFYAGYRGFLIDLDQFVSFYEVYADRQV